MCVCWLRKPALKQPLHSTAALTARQDCYRYLNRAEVTMVDTTKEAEKERKERELEEKQAQLRREIVKIMMDTSLSEEEKAHKRQALMMGGSTAGKKEEPTTASKKAGKKGSKKKQGSPVSLNPTGAPLPISWQPRPLQHTHPYTGQAEAKQESEEEESEEEEPSEEEETFLDDTLKCAMCMNLCERPVTVSAWREVQQMQLPCPLFASTLLIASLRVTDKIFDTQHKHTRIHTHMRNRHLASTTSAWCASTSGGRKPSTSAPPAAQTSPSSLHRTRGAY
eukprot:1161571-Pelagomonas_calceolata.AAC.5